jgi:hypothetical protein
MGIFKKKKDKKLPENNDGQKLCKNKGCNTYTSEKSGYCINCQYRMNKGNAN